MRYVVRIAEQTLELDVLPRAEGGFVVRGPDGRESAVTSLGGEPNAVSLLVDGQVLTVLPTEGEIRLRGESYPALAENWHDSRISRVRDGERAPDHALDATMPGRIVRVLCEAGTQVAANTPLIVIEAMKMQNELCAKSSAVVRAVHVEVGQTVERGALLVEFE